MSSDDRDPLLLVPFSENVQNEIDSSVDCAEDEAANSKGTNGMQGRRCSKETQPALGNCPACPFRWYA